MIFDPNCFKNIVMSSHVGIVLVVALPEVPGSPQPVSVGPVWPGWTQSV